MQTFSTKQLIARIGLVASLIALIAPLSVEAAGNLSSRSVTLGTSVAGTTNVTYAYAWTAGTTDTVRAVKFEVCDSPVETVACANASQSAGADFSGASIAGAPSPTGVVGFASGGASTNSFLITKAAGVAETANTTTNTISIAGITNPTATNQQFYLRITTYNSDTTQNSGTEIDYGAVAVSTATALSLSGTVPPTLQFCVGVTVTATCSSATGNAVDFGFFSPSSTTSGTSQMAASTNAGGGYGITINGTTLTSGAHSFPAMGTQTLNSSNTAASSIGTSQFGTNVVANTVPSVGVNPDNSLGGTGAGFGGYASSNGFRFFSGDTVATAPSSTKGTLYTNSYIVNMAGDQTAGLYTTTLTYICTGTF